MGPMTDSDLPSRLRHGAAASQHPPTLGLLLEAADALATCKAAAERALGATAGTAEDAVELLATEHLNLQRRLSDRALVAAEDAALGVGNRAHDGVHIREARHLLQGVPVPPLSSLMDGPDPEPVVLPPRDPDRPARMMSVRLARPALPPGADDLHRSIAAAVMKASARLAGATEEMLRGLRPGQRLAVGVPDALGAVQMLVLPPGQQPPLGKCWTVYGPAPLDPDLGPLEYGVEIKDGADLQRRFGGIDPEHATQEQAERLLGLDVPDFALMPKGARLEIVGGGDMSPEQVLAAFSPRVTVEPRPTMGIWEVYVDGTRDIPEAPLMVEAVTRAQAQRKAVNVLAGLRWPHLFATKDGE